MNTLFLCTANEHRSRTAEWLMLSANPEASVRSAGLSRRECARSGGRLCDYELLAWADVIIAMEVRHRDRVNEYTGGRFDALIEVLGIEDLYHFRQPELIKLLEQKLGDYLRQPDE